MSLLAPLALAGLALAVPILLLYMLRLRRREVVVSSTFLWSQVLRDREANTPWQRLRRNLLLFLQLLVLLALVFALARPYLLVPAVSSGQIALLLDASASMNARLNTVGGQTTRFDEAVRRAREIASTLSAGTTMTLLRVADEIEILQPYTADRGALLAALDGAQPGAAGADWATALTIAAAGRTADAGQFSTLIVSDGGGALQGDSLLTIPGTIQYIPVGLDAPASNLALSALAARALPGQPPQLFAQIENTGEFDAETLFSLRADGELIDAGRYTVPANGVLPIVSPLPEGFTAVSAALTPPGDQADNAANLLPDDDTAYAVAPARGERRVLLITTGSPFLEDVLRALPGISLTLAAPGSPISRAYDLLVLEGVPLPNPLPPGDLLVFNPPANTAYWTLGAAITADEQPGAFANIRSSADPRLAYVDVSALQLRAFRPITAPWAEPLITAAGGALLLAGETDGRQIAVFPFALADSDLPLQIAFPILIQSLVASFTPGSIVDLPEGNARIGEVVPLQLPPATETARVILPDGTTQPLESRAAAFTGTTRAGLYTVEADAANGQTETAAFSVNLFDPPESDLTPAATINIGGQTVGEAQAETIGQQEFWPLLAALALLLLMLEWFAYHRRQRTPSLSFGSPGQPGQSSRQNRPRRIGRIGRVFPLRPQSATRRTP